MTILGIDPGTATVGFGVITKEKIRGVKVLEFGTLQTKKTTKESARLLEIFLDVKQVLRKHQPDVVVVEKLFFATNQKTAIAVAQARGVILLAVEEAGCRLVELTPLEVKSRLCGFGKADKKQVQRVVKQMLGLKSLPSPDDAADALALALCGL